MTPMEKGGIELTSHYIWEKHPVFGGIYRVLNRVSLCAFANSKSFLFIIKDYEQHMSL